MKRTDGRAVSLSPMVGASVAMSKSELYDVVRRDLTALPCSTST